MGGNLRPTRRPAAEPAAGANASGTVGGEELHAPRLVASEAATALWPKTQLSQTERADAGAALAWLPDLPGRRSAISALSRSRRTPRGAR